jgi:5-methylcytosine-specific restriction enzyme A
MTTYLLTWNPNRWTWTDLSLTAHRVREEGCASMRWSCGNTRRIEAGDRVFLLRQGAEPRGIVASGTVIEPPYEDVHWDEDASKPALYVDVKLDALLDPDADDILPRELLEEPPYSEMHWNAQSSGTTMPARVASALEEAWGRLLDGPPSRPTATPRPSKLYEGAAYAVTLTGYERNRQARQDCIEYYGASCFLCGLNFGEEYGPPGDGYIHVHHLFPLSDSGESHEVDPIEDLRPVCPNCHAVIHRRSPPYTMEEMRQILGDT